VLSGGVGYGQPSRTDRRPTADRCRPWFGGRWARTRSRRAGRARADESSSPQGSGRVAESQRPGQWLICLWQRAGRGGRDSNAFQACFASTRRRSVYSSKRRVPSPFSSQRSPLDSAPVRRNRPWSWHAGGTRREASGWTRPRTRPRGGTLMPRAKATLIGWAVRIAECGVLLLRRGEVCREASVHRVRAATSRGRHHHRGLHAKNHDADDELDDESSVQLTLGIA
jgi:hypothetical protein